MTNKTTRKVQQWKKVGALLHLINGNKKSMLAMQQKTELLIQKLDKVMEELQLEYEKEEHPITEERINDSVTNSKVKQIHKAQKS